MLYNQKKKKTKTNTETNRIETKTKDFQIIKTNLKWENPL